MLTIIYHVIVFCECIASLILLLKRLVRTLLKDCLIVLISVRLQCYHIVVFVVVLYHGYT